MYAIVKTGGKQYKVEQGQTLLVERLHVDEGQTVSLEPLMIRGEGEAVTIDAAGLAKAKVEAKVVAHERGPKLRVVKFKPKRGYRRRNGHRQELTRIEVTSVGLGAGSTAAKPKAAAAPKAAAKPKAPVESKAAVETAASEKED